MVSKMAATLRHRGPDHGGTWIDARAGVALGHRRLAIRDLSATGNQPMTSSCGRFVISYNGELYNTNELLERMPRQTLRGTSDTEVLLETIAREGVAPALKLAKGMFAFALWDTRDQRLYLARDRMGEKPLYYGFVDGQWVFASELKAITAVVPALDVDPTAVAQLLKYGYICEPCTIYEGVLKLPPGTYLVLDAAGTPAKPGPITYWDFWSCVISNRAQAFTDRSQAVDALASSLRRVVTAQLAADVPVGCYLSGGIDSALVAATMVEVAGARVKTFTIGFDDKGYDESTDARAIADYLGTEHVTEILTPSSLLEQVERLPQVFDEPYADPSALPSMLLAGIARRAVTVCLSGDGGDELFAGYNRYRWAVSLWRYLKPISRATRRRLVGLLDRVSSGLGGAERRQLRVQKLTRFVTANSLEHAYETLLSQFPDTWSAILAADPQRPLLPDAGLDPIDQLLALDQRDYLVNDNLQKVDRTSMYHSLETRIPLLHSDIVELSWRVPSTLKVRRGRSKWLLKELLATKIPRRLFERPKRGFSVPIASWLRAELKSWSRDLLDSLPEMEGLPAKETVTGLWSEHVNGVRNHAPKLWSLLAFALWWNQVGSRR
jgi:asparagine synthase (glutamine-hydrolysing)